jgi:hypothetical protein
MISQTIDTKTYNLFLATEAQTTHYDKRLLISTVFDAGYGKQGRCVVLPLRTDSTVEDEIQTAIHFVLRFMPVPNRDLVVNLYHGFSGSIDLPLSHTKVTASYLSPVQNPAIQPLKHFSRNLAPMI